MAPKKQPYGANVRTVDDILRDAAQITPDQITEVGRRAMNATSTPLVSGSGVGRFNYGQGASTSTQTLMSEPDQVQLANRQRGRQAGEDFLGREARKKEREDQIQRLDEDLFVLRNKQRRQEQDRLALGRDVRNNTANLQRLDEHNQKLARDVEEARAKKKALEDEIESENRAAGDLQATPVMAWVGGAVGRVASGAWNMLGRRQQEPVSTTSMPQPTNRQAILDMIRGNISEISDQRFATRDQLQTAMHVVSGNLHALYQAVERDRESRETGLTLDDVRGEIDQARGQVQGMIDRHADMLGGEIQSLRSHVDAKHGDLQSQITASEAALRRDMKSQRQDIAQDLQRQRAELGGLHNAHRDEMLERTQGIDHSLGALGRGIEAVEDRTRGAIDGLRRELTGVHQHQSNLGRDVEKLKEKSTIAERQKNRDMEQRLGMQRELADLKGKYQDLNERVGQITAPREPPPSTSAGVQTQPVQPVNVDAQTSPVRKPSHSVATSPIKQQSAVAPPAPPPPPPPYITNAPMAYRRRRRMLTARDVAKEHAQSQFFANVQILQPKIQKHPPLPDISGHTKKKRKKPIKSKVFKKSRKW